MAPILTSYLPKIQLCEQKVIDIHMAYIPLTSCFSFPFLNQTVFIGHSLHFSFKFSKQFTIDFQKQLNFHSRQGLLYIISNL